MSTSTVAEVSEILAGHEPFSEEQFGALLKQVRGSVREREQFAADLGRVGKRDFSDGKQAFRTAQCCFALGRYAEHILKVVA